VGDIGIYVEALGKKYRVGRRQEKYRTIRDTLASAVLGPVRMVRSLVSGDGNRWTADEWFWALKDVSFELKRGEVLGIIGRNGAGKSTLLKILSRITEPTEGYAEIRGRIVSLLEVGTGFHQELTGRENIFLNGAILGMRRREIERKFDEIVAFSEVEKFIDTPVKHYSSGMYLRLAFSVAAHLEPEILLVDEVLAVGDAAFQKKCLGKMGEVAQEGRTVLFVSHNMGAISNLCRSALCLEDGRLADIGETESVIAGYVSRTSADIPDKGVSDLRSVKRSPELGSGRARLQWVRTLNAELQQRATFLEQEPIVVEVGFVILRTVRNLQLGCSVVSLNPNVELFTIPSREYSGEFPSGTCSVRLRIDPNYLREGSYTIGLKVFADGLRQDTIGDTLRFHIVRYVSADEDNAHFARWVAGPLLLPYKWEEIQSNLGRVVQSVGQ